MLQDDSPSLIRLDGRINTLEEVMKRMDTTIQRVALVLEEQQREKEHRAVMGNEIRHLQNEIHEHNVKISAHESYINDHQKIHVRYSTIVAAALFVAGVLATKVIEWLMTM